jgi:catechol 2,3-dioxygenase-like lactoylglutathione lyase family enzyme
MTFTQIKETCLYIKSIERARKFYHDKLELPVISSVERRHIFFRAGESVLLCFIAEATKNEKVLPPHFSEGNQHLAFEVPVESYHSEKQKIKEKGIDIIYTQDWREGYESFYFLDYEENVLEIVPSGLWDY